MGGSNQVHQSIPAGISGGEKTPRLSFAPDALINRLDSFTPARTCKMTRVELMNSQLWLHGFSTLDTLYIPEWECLKGGDAT